MLLRVESDLMSVKACIFVWHWASLCRNSSLLRTSSSFMCRAAPCDGDTPKVSGFGQKGLLYPPNKVPLDCTVTWVSLLPANKSFTKHTMESIVHVASSCLLAVWSSLSQALNRVLKESGTCWTWEKSCCVYLLVITNYSVSINLLVIEIKQISGWAQHFKGVLIVH